MSCNFISTNQELRTGEYIKSVNNEYYAILQNDSNLVVYRRGHGAVWATGTVDSSAVRLVLQSDGNLVMFDSDKRVVWQSDTTAEPPSSRMRLTITNQGSLLLDNDGDAIWSSACSAKDKTK
ncbi:B-type lectin plumieribetin-like [Periophthalmus magnuspinnatus]|uniref:B-type lectin plumieribetin-like n=1 Tax=Periophthalmus magnuspinnatus TaxID=409849 RepID=UPI00145B6CDB|nr:B-type lectin plumieribetin-like [Periophthalmus magnuspinnatus]